jgi:oligopeptide transport system substrate-binding protein
VEGWAFDEPTAARLRDSGWADIEPPPWPDRRFVSLDPDTGRFRQRHVWTKPGRLVGNGPYVLTDWRYKRGLYVERNPLYHTPDVVRSETIACVSIEDINTAVLAFESGRIDWLSDVSVEYQGDLLAQRAAYETRHASEIASSLSAGRTLDETLAGLPPPTRGQRRNIHMLPTFGTDFYSFNCRAMLDDGRANPFADAAVRRAFVKSVDKALIVRRVTRLDEPVATSLVPPGAIPGYTPPAGLVYDPDDARQQLAAAGWSDLDGDGLVEDGNGELFPVVDLLYSTNGTRYRNISLALRDMWQRELGVRVELRGKESKFFREDLRQGNFMIGRGGWYGDYGDPTTFLDLCRTGDGNNVRGFSSQRVDDLLNRAADEADQQARFELLQACERLLVTEEVPVLVLCQYVQMYMYEPGRLTGLSRHPRLTQYLWKMKADR